MPEKPNPPVPAITLEEWIAATQSCCGGEPDKSPRGPDPGDSARGQKDAEVPRADR